MANKRKENPSVVCIGGGTGMSTMLRGLKNPFKDITAIVAVSDDGGGSGVLRQELGMPPPGDIRNCIQALSNVEPTMERLMGYRFQEGSLKGQSFGNLFLAAMNGISSSFDEAVARAGEVLAITGRVMPVTNDDIQLEATFADGGTVLGESRISVMKKQHRCRIASVRLVPEHPPALEACIQAILKADLLILGPGSLYTSIIPNLLVDGISEAIAKTDALRVYVCNVMTQPGETEDYTASDHVKAIFAHGGGKMFDYCLVNAAPDVNSIIETYRRDGAEPVAADLSALRSLGVEPEVVNISGYDGNFFRHNPWLLAYELYRFYMSHCSGE